MTMPRPELSQRELEVLRAWLVHDSKSAAAKVLFISQSTLSTHITRIRVKYARAGRPAHTKAALLARALQFGHITMEELP